MITPIIPIMKGKYGNMGWMVHWRGEVDLNNHYSIKWPCSSPALRTPPWWSGSRGTRTRPQWCRSAWRTCCSANKCYSISFNSVSQSLHWYFQRAYFLLWISISLRKAFIMAISLWRAIFTFQPGSCLHLDIDVKIKELYCSISGLQLRSGRWGWEVFNQMRLSIKFDDEGWVAFILSSNQICILQKHIKIANL